MFRQQLAPVAGSLTLSAILALLPLLVIFVLLGVMRVKAHWAGLVSVAVAVIVAATAFKMPIGLALLSGTEGAVFGLFPIMWIVFNALWVYQLTVVSGRFEDLRGSFNLVSADPRIMAVLIAFCFGALLEALAGFGAPVAITAAMLMALGFSAFRAASVVLLANTAPVAFGAIAIPILTAAGLTQIPVTHLGAMVGRQTPLLAWFVPLILIMLVDGRRGLRQAWPAALLCGVTFAVAQYVSANYISVEMTDIIATLVAAGATILFLRFWRPAGTQEALRSVQGEDAVLVGASGSGGASHRLERVSTGGGIGTDTRARAGSGTGAGTGAGPGSGTGAGPGTGAANGSGTDIGGTADEPPEPHLAGTAGLTGARIGMALAPYAIIIVVFAVARLVGPINDFLLGHDIKIPWPGLNGHVLSASGKPSASTVYNFQWLSSPGSLLLFCGILVALLYRINPLVAIREYGRTAYQLRWAFLTVASVLALAYVMNLSGQTLTIGNWIAATGAFFAFLSPILGWMGTAVTGSDTSANALFATLQQAGAHRAGIDPTLLVAANTSGGVVGKMISPQNLTIAATTVGILGREGDLFRRLIRWSLAILLVLCVVVYLQSTPVLGWMLP